MQTYKTNETRRKMKSERNIILTTQWQPKKLDLYLAAIIAFLLPVIAGQLYGLTGALLPMLLYYGLAWGIVKWRRKSSGYFNPFPKRITAYFYLNLGVILTSLVCAYLARNQFASGNSTGILLTALIWAPLNAATEQLLWIYLFESWDLYPCKTTPCFPPGRVASVHCLRRIDPYHVLGKIP